MSSRPDAGPTLHSSRCVSAPCLVHLSVRQPPSRHPGVERLLSEEMVSPSAGAVGIPPASPFATTACALSVMWVWDRPLQAPGTHGPGLCALLSYLCVDGRVLADGLSCCSGGWGGHWALGEFCTLSSDAARRGLSRATKRGLGCMWKEPRAPHADPPCPGRAYGSRQDRFGSRGWCAGAQRAVQAGPPPPQL